MHSAAVENYLQFFDGDALPQGSLDLDCLALEQNPEFRVVLKLGFAYAGYRLEIYPQPSLSWKIWQCESLVLTTDERLIGTNIPFTCLPTEVQVPLTTVAFEMGGKKFSGACTGVQILAEDRGKFPVLQLNLQTGGKIFFAAGQEVRQDNPDMENEWPSEEWKDWNTM